jgi:hypothetical protein
MRKRLSLLLVLCLSVVMAYGVIGSGATFIDQVTAQENINVATFACEIVGATGGAAIASDHKSVTYDAPTIVSSVPGSAPFWFSVKNTGGINQTLSVATSPIGAPFAIINAPIAARPLAAGATTKISTGVQWGELTNANLGAQGTVTWTVSCNEQGPTTPLGFFNLASTNANNIAGTTPGHPGTIGPSVTTVDNGSGSVTLNFTAGGPATDSFQSCFEYVTDGNVPQQRLMTGGVFRTNYLPTLTDGLFPFVCVGDGQPHSASVTLNGISLVQVRMSFGAEGDYRFDWTSFSVAQ